MDRPSGKQSFRKAIVAIPLLAALFVLYCFDPVRTAIFPPCPFHLVTGCHCPGCGSLRAIHSLLHGHLAGAMAQNPLMVVSIPVVGVMLFSPAWIYKRWVPWAAMIVLIVYGVIRNMPVWPLTLLAPQ